MSDTSHRPSTSDSPRALTGEGVAPPLPLLLHSVGVQAFMVQSEPSQPSRQAQPQPSTWLPVTEPPLEQVFVHVPFVVQSEPSQPPVQLQEQPEGVPRYPEAVPCALQSAESVQGALQRGKRGPKPRAHVLHLTPPYPRAQAQEQLPMMPEAIPWLLQSAESVHSQ